MDDAKAIGHKLVHFCRNGLNLEAISTLYGPDIVDRQRGATGVDESYATAARGLGVAVVPHPVTDEGWDRLGKRAGPIRNAEMVADFQESYYKLRKSRAS